jgi:hypothetical protein
MTPEARDVLAPIAVAPAVPAPPRLGDPHRPRPVRFIRLEPRGDWRLKVYGIATPGRSPRPELVGAALDLAGAALPAPAVSDERYGVGIVIAHDSATYCFALYYWWQSANELHQRVYAAPIANPRGLTKLADPAAGCVFELSVVDFERRAWMEDVLANPRGPDIERYLMRRFDADI